MVPRQLPNRYKSSKSSGFMTVFAPQTCSAPIALQAGWNARIFNIVGFYSVSWSARACSRKPPPLLKTDSNCTTTAFVRWEGRLARLALGKRAKFSKNDPGQEEMHFFDKLITKATICWPAWEGTIGQALGGRQASRVWAWMGQEAVGLRGFGIGLGDLGVGLCDCTVGLRGFET